MVGTTVTSPMTLTGALLLCGCCCCLGSILDLHMLSQMALVNRANCCKISSLGQEVVRLLEHAGV